MRFTDRHDAGKQLAARLGEFRGRNTIVLALPRGGVVPAAEIARELHAPLGVIVVRKISHPLSEEYAIGAIAENDRPIYDDEAVRMVDEEWLEQAELYSTAEIAKRQAAYHKVAPPLDSHNKTVIVVDDGMATGLTMKAALKHVRNSHPAKIILALPVASSESLITVRPYTDEILLLDDPAHFLGAVGAHYRSFDQVTNEEVCTLLQEAAHDLSKNTAAATSPP